MAWYNNWGDFTDTVSNGYDWVCDELSDGAEAVEQNAKAALKQLNIASIKYIHAPIRKGEREDAKMFFDEYAKLIASETKGNLEKVADELDKDIEGKLSKSIQTAMEKKTSEYDALSE